MNISELLNDRKLNINLDSDGIISYLFLKKFDIGGGIGGYNNSDDFIDIFSPKEKITTVDQHTISVGDNIFIIIV